MDWGRIIGLVGGAISGGSKSIGQDRQAQDVGNIARDRTALDAIGERERAELERRKLELDQRELDLKTRDGGYKQALNAQYLQNWTPAQRPSRIPTVHGGFNTVPQSSKDLAAKFEQDATVRALKGESFTPMAPMQKFTPTPVKEPSLWEKITGAAGLSLTAAGALKKAMKVGGGGMEEDGGL